VCAQKQLVTSARQKYWRKFDDISDLHLGPPRLAFGTPRGSRDPRLRTTGVAFVTLRASVGKFDELTTKLQFLFWIFFICLNVTVSVAV